MLTNCTLIGIERDFDGGGVLGLMGACNRVLLEEIPSTIVTTTNLKQKSIVPREATLKLLDNRIGRQLIATCELPRYNCSIRLFLLRMVALDEHLDWVTVFD